MKMSLGLKMGSFDLSELSRGLGLIYFKFRKLCLAIPGFKKNFKLYIFIS